MQYGYHPHTKAKKAQMPAVMIFMICMIWVNLTKKGSVRTKYGTKEEYKEAVKALQDNGIQVYVDVVPNHMGGADETEKIKVLKVK